MAHKQQEEEAKKKKDEEDAHKQAEAEAAAIIAAQEKKSEMEMDKPDGNLNRNLHNIFNGILYLMYKIIGQNICTLHIYILQIIIPFTGLPFNE